MSAVTVLASADGAREAESAATALAASGVRVGTCVDFDTALGAARRENRDARLVLWGIGASAGVALRVAAGDDRVAGVIAVAPLVDDLITRLELVRAQPLAAARAMNGIGTLVREHRAGRTPTHLRCPVLVQVADEDPAERVAAAMRTAWRTGADVRHYPCTAAALFDGDLLARFIEHELVFLRQRLA